MQYSIALVNARLQAIENVIGPSPQLRIYQGTMPLTVGGLDAATLLATLILPVDWMDDPVLGIVNLLGSWHTDAAVFNGTAQYFRVWNAAGDTAHIQGTISLTGGTGDLQLDNTDVATGQALTISAWEILGGNL